MPRFETTRCRGTGNFEPAALSLLGHHCVGPVPHAYLLQQTFPVGNPILPGTPPRGQRQALDRPCLGNAALFSLSKAALRNVSGGRALWEQ